MRQISTAERKIEREERQSFMQLWAKERADKQAAQLAAEQQESMLKAKREARLQREMKIIVSHARCLLLPPTANYCHQLPTTTTTTTLSLLACYCYLLWVWMVPVLLTAPWLDGASSTYSPRPSNQWGCRPSKPSWWVHCPSAPLPLLGGCTARLPPYPPPTIHSVCGPAFTPFPLAVW